MRLNSHIKINEVIIMKNYEETRNETNSLLSGVVIAVIAIIMAASPTVLAMNHVLDVTIANVIFGMATWYVFALCAFIAGCLFIRRGLAHPVSAPKRLTA